MIEVLDVYSIYKDKISKFTWTLYDNNRVSDKFK